MADSNKITDRAAQLAAQAAAAAGPLKDRAAEIAAAAATAAAPRAHQVKERATVIAERAGEVSAKGVAAAATSLDKATGGKYSDTIKSVSEKVNDRLDPDKPI